MSRISLAGLRITRAAVALGIVLSLASCLGELASPRGAVGEARLELHGLRARSQVGSGAEDEVQSARFVVYALSGTSRREVASRLFTAQDLDVIDSDTGTVFKISFPYTGPNDEFEVIGYGFSTQGDTLYRVGPVAFTMKDAASQAGSTAVTVVTPPIYVGPGRTATRLTISPRLVATEEGKTTAVSATLYDATGKALSSPTFRVRWHTLDNGVANLPDELAGVVMGGPRAGSTKLVAYFEPMELSDTVDVANGVRAGQVRVIGGNNQTGRVSTPLGSPISVQVMNATGTTPMPGVQVSFVVTQGGGSVNAATRTTSAPDGVATVAWTLGATVGPQLLTISVAGLPSITATATAQAAAPVAGQSSITVLPTAILAGGDPATVTVTLRDADRNPVPNTIVTFSGPSSALFSPASAATNANGVATSQVRASAAGTMTITVLVGTQTIGTATLSVGALAGIPSSISVYSGDNQTVQIGRDFPQPLVVVVRDATGATVAGALVDWATTVGEGRKVTDSDGRSSAIYALPANWAAGPGTIVVTLTGRGQTVTFRFTAVP